MINPPIITRVLLLAAIGVTVVLALLGLRTQERNLAALRDADKASLLWVTTQLELEIEHFLTDLGRYSLGDELITRTGLSTRFDIVWSRLNILSHGETSRLFLQYDGSKGVLNQIGDLLKRYEYEISHLPRDNPTLSIQIVRDFEDMRGVLRELVFTILNAEAERTDQVRNLLRTTNQQTYIFSLSAMVLGGIVVLVMLIENRRYIAIARESQHLAQDAEKNTQAKSRFLTMMSHELRTPLNGVLGLMALVKQSGVSASQARLITQSERSGEQMVELLEDILDYSELQADTLELSATIFDLMTLAENIETKLKTIAARNGIGFEIRYRSPQSTWIAADFGRLAQSLTHFAVYLIETVGSRHLTLFLGYEDGHLAVEFDVLAPHDEYVGWQPEHVLGREDEDYSEFASDSLGPMIARALISLMGGTITLHRQTPTQATLSVQIPLSTRPHEGELVRIVARSRTTAILASSAVERSRWMIWKPGMLSSAVVTVLLEPDGQSQADEIAALRREHPDAQIISLGKPAFPSEFDGVCPMPLTAENFAITMSSVLRAAS